MRKWMIVTLVAFMTMLAGNNAVAFAGQGVYLGIQGGATILEDVKSDFVKSEMETGYVISGVAGYDFGAFRLEGEIAYRENDIDKISYFNDDTDSSGDVSAFTFMVNGYFDFENRTAFTPYIGAGIGYARVDVEGKAAYTSWGSTTTVELDDDDSGLAYQLMAGLAWDLSDNFALDLSYRYLGCDDIEMAGTSESYSGTLKGDFDYESHNILMGLKWFF